MSIGTPVFMYFYPYRADFITLETIDTAFLINLYSEKTDAIEE
jgi:hypothetical protein